MMHEYTTTIFGETRSVPFRFLHRPMMHEYTTTVEPCKISRREARSIGTPGLAPTIAFASCHRATWRDTDGLPGIFRARQQRSGYDQTLAYYDEAGKSPGKVDKVIEELGAGDCPSWFSFPGGHTYPPVARRLSFAWFDRWLGHEPAFPIPGTT